MKRPRITDSYTIPPGYDKYYEFCQRAIEWLIEHLYSYEERTMVGYLANRFSIEKEDAQIVYDNIMSVFGSDC